MMNGVDARNMRNVYIPYIYNNNMISAREVRDAPSVLLSVRRVKLIRRVITTSARNTMQYIYIHTYNINVLFGSRFFANAATIFRARDIVFFFAPADPLRVAVINNPAPTPFPDN